MIVGAAMYSLEERNDANDYISLIKKWIEKL
jgi:hypothetical protein